MYVVYVIKCTNTFKDAFLKTGSTLEYLMSLFGITLESYSVFICLQILRASSNAFSSQQCLIMYANYMRSRAMLLKYCVPFKFQLI